MTVWGNKRRLWAAAAAAAITAAVAVRTFRGGPSGYELVTTELRPMADELHERGFLEATAVTPVELGASGEIQEMAGDGTVVSAGEIVARIDATSYLEQLVTKENEIETADTTLAIRKAWRAAAESELADTLVLASNRLSLAELEWERIRRGLAPDERRALEITCSLRQIELEEAEAVVTREREWVAAGLASVATLEDAERRLAAARAALEEAQIDFTIQTGPPRPETLLESVRTVERLRGEFQRSRRSGERKLARADAEIGEAHARLTLSQIEYQQISNEWVNCAVPAPTSGVFRARLFADWRQGGVWQVIKPGVTRGRLDRVADIVQPGEMRVQLMLHEADIERVSTGMPVRIRVPALNAGKTFYGSLQALGGVGRDRFDVAPRGVEQSVSGVTVFNASAALDASDPAFRPGMSVLAVIEREPVRDRLVIPREAVGRDAAAGDRVRLANGQIRPVTGRLFGNRFYEVSGGLQAGDRLHRSFQEATP